MTAIETTTAYSFATATISSTVIELAGDLTFTAETNIQDADRARITCATQPVRYRYDGGDPDASTGHLLAVGSETIIEGNQNILALKFIRATGSDGAISVTLEQF